ncbi:hypothetical protein BKA59DRAFT_258905 [Fusarium tricinctum]|uniref:Uncharacterized protein n=1 Tax=Fusarium tricinctum TaxID=61284 RepID=A0A8K0W8X5_9HYPO|nr:hypothetical protein BKA59DRAFT_258905 [Fusarium tricinctum]
MDDLLPTYPIPLLILIPAGVIQILDGGSALLPKGTVLKLVSLILILINLSHKLTSLYKTTLPTVCRRRRRRKTRRRLRN